MSLFKKEKKQDKVDFSKILGL